MSLINLDIKLAAQILGLVILIITLILALGRFLTNNSATTTTTTATATATATQILPGGNLAVSDALPTAAAKAIFK